MPIYKSEIKDGLQGQIESNKTIAMDCKLSKVESKDSFHKKAKASLGQDKDFDLYYLSSVLASVGSNKNDDTFLPEEIWAAKDTPVHKQFNYNHNEKDVIGCIFDSFLLDAAGELITSEDRVQDIKDICTYSAIWTKWSDGELQDRMQSIIAAIDNNELFVSMEALFKDFDYLLTNDKESKIIARSETTAFLTKHLRSFGGEGVFQDYKIKRVLRNFTFSGKGLVHNPANSRSFIDPNIIIISKGSENKNESNTDMSDVLEKTIAELKAELAIARETAEKMKAEAASNQEKAISDEISSLNETVATLTAEKASVMKQNEELQSLAESMKEDMEKKKKEAEEAMAELEKDLKDKEDKIKVMKDEKVVASRVQKLVEAGQKVDKANEICVTFASTNDEQFDSIVQLYKVENVEKNTEDESDETESPESEGEDFNDVTEVETQATANLNDFTSVSDDVLKAIAEEMKQSLNPTKE